MVLMNDPCNTNAIAEQIFAVLLPEIVNFITFMLTCSWEWTAFQVTLFYREKCLALRNANESKIPFARVYISNAKLLIRA